MNDSQLEILLKDLISLPRECEYVEFKENKNDPTKIGQYLSALSNSAAYNKEPYGYIVWGIEDGTHQKKGTKFKPKQEKGKGDADLEMWLSVHLNPRISFEIFEFVSEGMNFVIFRVPRMRGQPVTFEGNAYIRIGANNTKLYDHPERARKLWTQDNDIAFEREICTHNLTSNEVLALINVDVFYKLFNLQKPSEKSAQISKLKQEQIIVPIGEAYNVTNLGALLFAADIAKFELLGRRAIRVTTYIGKNRVNALKDQQAAYGYAVGFKGLIKYLDNNLPRSEVITKSIRTIVPEYPTVALREIVANAIIHQDFDIKGMSPRIEIFSDRVEVTNPGVPLIDTDRFIDHTPRSRNEILAKFMYRLNFCEERGSGFDRVVQLCEQYQMPSPKVFVHKNYTTVVLYKSKQFKDMDAEERRNVCYSHACLKFVNNETMTNQSLRERFALLDSEQTSVSNIIASAITLGLIKYSDPNNTSKRYSTYIPYWA